MLRANAAVKATASFLGTLTASPLLVPGKAKYCGFQCRDIGALAHSHLRCPCLTQGGFCGSLTSIAKDEPAFQADRNSIATSLGTAGAFNPFMSRLSQSMRAPSVIPPARQRESRHCRCRHSNWQTALAKVMVLTAAFSVAAHYSGLYECPLENKFARVGDAAFLKAAREDNGLEIAEHGGPAAEHYTVICRVEYR